MIDYEITAQGDINVTATHYVSVTPVRPAGQPWIIITNVRSTSDRTDASINVIKVTLLLTELLLRLSCLPLDTRYREPITT